MWDWFKSRDHYCYPIRGNDTKIAKDHFFALQAAAPDMKGFLLLDGNGSAGQDEVRKEGNLAIHRWKRYEIENYLIHRDSIERFINARYSLFTSGAMDTLQGELPPKVYAQPLGDHDYLENTAASKSLLPLIFERMKVYKREYYQIAAVMKPEEIHPDVKQALDVMADHLRLMEPGRCPQVR